MTLEEAKEWAYEHDGTSIAKHPLKDDYFILVLWKPYSDDSSLDIRIIYEFDSGNNYRTERLLTIQKFIDEFDGDQMEFSKFTKWTMNQARWEERLARREKFL